MTPPICATWFRKSVLSWYAKHGRHDLPWKSPLSPYRVWVSEIMLQQTQVATVIPYFDKFMRAFPTVAHLAKASLDDVLAHWAGLGYYARGRNLHKTAQMIIRDFKGTFPQTTDALQTLPGIGLSTAGAIVAQAFNAKATICDGNVKRVLSRFHCVKGALNEKQTENTLWDLACFYTPSKNVADYTQAIMDIGATLCTRTKPKCEICPLQAKCEAYKQGNPLSFPQRKKSKRLPWREVHLLCAINKKQEILLYPRPLTGIWGGLWSLPEFEQLSDLQTFAQTEKLQALPEFKHTFTHFHLLIKPQLMSGKIRVKDKRMQWVGASSLATIGLPSPIKKLLSNNIISQKMRA